MTSTISGEDDLVGLYDLSIRLEEAMDTLTAIRTGQVDALVVRSGEREQIYTLKGANHTYRILFEMLNEGALTLGADASILFANTRFAELVGCPLERVSGASFAAFVAPADRDRFAELLATGLQSNSKGEISLMHSSGRQVPAMVSLNHVPVEGARNTCSAVVSDLTDLRAAQEALERSNSELEIRVDARTAELIQANRALQSEITERGRLEEELRQQTAELAEAHQRKDEFLSMLAHELRNPLAPILYSTQALELLAHEQPAIQRHCGVIERQVQHMARLVDDLLDVSRITRGSIVLRKEVISLHEIVERAVESVRPLVESREHSLRVSLPAKSLWLEVDATRLEQVLVNLLTNAAKYSDRGGDITITAERQGRRTVVRVKDTGIGIPADLLPHVFDLFVQEQQSLDRAQGGLGIGLTLVKGLVESHGGAITAHSEGPGSDSEFVVTLPSAAAPAPADTPPAPPVTVRRAGVRVLIVEDNPESAETLTELLELWGHEVCHAAEGAEALDLAHTFRPDVALVDIGLPGMDGYALARRLRSEANGQPPLLVAITGYGRDDDRRKSREAGFDHHLVKPIDLQTLRQLVTEAPAR
ncbi:MAG: ATP-binding protein [Actinomycetota bacterium]